MGRVNIAMDELTRTNNRMWACRAHLRNLNWQYYRADWFMRYNVTLDDINRAQHAYDLACAQYQVARRDAGLEYILTAKDNQLLETAREE